ncbi:8-oxoguanine DNA glycosylase [Trypanosoma cruzi Dm28c]|uniref:DNA-(apurinic or apyrimidinic site) lyase n=2 Tax=Trypanosoma cruzi TaxID=5693 RepID=V5BKI1_TRYCR|nr:8-oxoguanine DNA glycosylase [Trypanosoma cruzi Dm28c]PBJ69947.1 8-oxoguanine DNA glycosylase [Trypanosoma cruzi cruzi]PWV00281.1 putative 8-oxoguanine DNA glycosylase [Trypanosoma cruzi]
MMHAWYALPSPAAVNLPMTLCGGQCFRWRRTPRGTWVGVVERGAYELSDAAHPPEFQAVHSRGEEKRGMRSSLSHPSDDLTGDVLWFRCLHREPKNALDLCTEACFLRHYLALDVDLQKLWRRWTRDNPMRDHPLVRYLTSNAGKGPFVKIRHLRQNIHETLLAFLCSQNNNVQRITGLVEKLATSYGDHLCDYNLETGDVRNVGYLNHSSTRSTKNAKRADTGDGDWIPLHTIPSMDELARRSEDELRALGFGYRSKYIVQCASIIQSSGATRRKKEEGVNCFCSSMQSYKWYDDLLDPCLSLSDRREKLLSLPGVGRKVADCILLFAVGHHEIVPVDTHMAQVATEYLAGTATCSKKVLCNGMGEKRKRNSEGKSSLTAVSTDGSCWEKVLADWYRKGKERDMKMPALLHKHHDAIQLGFWHLFGDYCGWAHSILFYARMRRGQRDN